jgi:putative transposon-encoded protein
MALVLKDSILSVFEEYADSVGNSEKIAVLKELIKGLL